MSQMNITAREALQERRFRGIYHAEGQRLWLGRTSVHSFFELHIFEAEKKGTACEKLQSSSKIHSG